jgi:hypothetical protein
LAKQEKVTSCRATPGELGVLGGSQGDEGGVAWWYLDKKMILLIF